MFSLSFRSLKRWAKQLRADFLLRPRADEISRELQEHFKLPSAPVLKSMGSRKHDNIYRVLSGGKALGVLRLSNPHKKRHALASDLPYAMVMEMDKRLNREWQAYMAGAAIGLTPKPLWRTADALMNEFIPAKPLILELQKSPQKAWEIVIRAARALQQLHAAGIVHMDCCLQNMLGADGKVYFIDFEYVPANDMTFGMQRVYDHLRLLETAWKFIPEKQRGDLEPWLAQFSGSLDDEMRKTDLARLAPALPRLMKEEALVTQLRKLMRP